MNTQAQRGFTIIEVMLFLAISGALIIGVLVSSGVALGQQRYRDSVNSLKGFIQEQYSEIGNVINSETENPVCINGSTGLGFDSSKEQSRGTSDCLILGRFLLVQPTKVTAYNVIGEAASDDPGTDDTATLKNYALTITDPEAQDIAWGARIVKPKTTTDLTTSILVVRSPLSGSILTYAKDGNQKPAALLSAANMVQKDLCVDPQGLLSATSHRLAVRIDAGASAQSSVEIPLEKDSVCD